MTVDVFTNVYALPLVHIFFEIGNNEDWFDTIRYVTPLDEPVDLHGIAFNMQVRHKPPEYDVSLRASTANRMLRIGEGERYNHLIINVPMWRMQNIWTTGEYVGDIVANDERVYRVIATFDLRVTHGVTRWS